MLLKRDISPWMVKDLIFRGNKRIMLTGSFDSRQGSVACGAHMIKDGHGYWYSRYVSIDAADSYW